jgi:DNA-binding transcriptional regulator/RsmH inhibitor MraZ
MPRGGKREEAGRKSKFQHPTERMSLPGKFKAEIEEYALMLDREQTIDFCRLSEFERACENILKTIPPNKRVWAARLFNRLKGSLVSH